MKNNNDFEYKYSAPTAKERQEIESIRNSYTPQSESMTKLTKLRQLDRKIRNTPTILALVIGIISALVFGVGLTMLLEWNMWLWGTIISIIGIIPMLFTYTLYSEISKHLKKKYASEIIRISDELLNDETK